jgi:hypothetical protein
MKRRRGLVLRRTTDEPAVTGETAVIEEGVVMSRQETHTHIRELVEQADRAFMAKDYDRWRPLADQVAGILRCCPFWMQ